MSRSSRMEPLAALADREQREAARLLADSHRDLQRREQQLARLETYLDEYQRKPGIDGTGLSIGRWQNDRRFMERLSEVIASERANVVAAHAQHQARLERWRSSHLHNQAMQELLENYCREELLDRERAEQDELDELILRLLTRG